jgi:tetratricopeptide (TPR) repeat protein
VIARGLCLVALLLGATDAFADDSRARARALYDRGMAHYNVGAFDSAVEEFKQAYELTRAPGLLFNLAQACRLAKHDEEALHFYRSYLRERPNAPNRRDAQAFIAELEKRMATPTPAPAPVEPSAAPPPVEAPRVEAPAPVEKHEEHAEPARVEPRLVLPPPVVAAPPRPRAWAAAAGAVGAVGLAALGTAAYFAVAESDASRAVSGATTWSGDLQKTWDDGRRDAQVATALFVVGGVATGAAVVLAIVAARKSSKVLSRAPMIGPGSIGWSCAF